MLRSKLSLVIEDNRKLKSSKAYIEMMNMKEALEEVFNRESKKCKKRDSNKCNHKKSTAGICSIDECPK
jgi:hypothetical protein